MPTIQEELALRLDELERSMQEFATTVPRQAQPSFDLADAISFRAWMKISAPTFALMGLGFVLLWNAQQAHSAQLYEVTRTLGRLDGAVVRLEAATERFDDRMDRFDQRLVRFDERLASFDARLESFDARLESFDQRLGAIDATLVKLNASIDRLAERD